MTAVGRGKLLHPRMDLHQLKTFVVVAREGSITRASELLHLSQPAVSAHIKAMEDALDLPLFERTARGMSLTRDGQRLLVKAEQTLAAHRDLIDEATRIKGRVSGKLRLGAGTNSNPGSLERLLSRLAERCPEVEVSVEHGTSSEVLAALRGGTLDAGFYNEAGEPDPDLSTVEASRFTIHVAAPPGLVSEPVDWRALAEQPWIYPQSPSCCGRVAETLFEMKRFRPKRILSVDREDVTRKLIAAGVGVGLLHEGSAQEARDRGDVELVFESPSAVRVLFAHLQRRGDDPLLTAVTALARP